MKTHVKDILNDSEIDFLYNISSTKHIRYDPEKDMDIEHTSFDEEAYLDLLSSALLDHIEDLTVEDLSLLIVASKLEKQNTMLREIASAVWQVRD